MQFLTMMFEIILLLVAATCRGQCPLGTTRQFFTIEDHKMVKLDFENETAVPQRWPSIIVNEQPASDFYYLENDILVVPYPELQWKFDSTFKILIHYYKSNETVIIQPTDDLKHVMKMEVFFAWANSVFYCGNYVECYQFQKGDVGFYRIADLHFERRKPTAVVIGDVPCILGGEFGESGECLNTTSMEWYIDDNLPEVNIDRHDGVIVHDDVLYVCGHHWDSDMECRLVDLKKQTTEYRPIYLGGRNDHYFHMQLFIQNNTVMIAALVHDGMNNTALLTDISGKETKYVIQGDFYFFHSLCINEVDELTTVLTKPDEIASGERLPRTNLAVMVAGVVFMLLAVIVLGIAVWIRKRTTTCSEDTFAFVRLFGDNS